MLHHILILQLTFRDTWITIVNKPEIISINSTNLKKSFPCMYLKYRKVMHLWHKLLSIIGCFVLDKKHFITNSLILPSKKWAQCKQECKREGEENDIFHSVPKWSRKGSRRLGNAASIPRKALFFFLLSPRRSTVLALFYSGPGLYNER